MNTSMNSPKIKQMMILLIMLSGLMSAHSQAAMVSTSELINTGGTAYSTQDLQTALASDELKQQLENLGVDAVELNDRIASLTAEEIQQLNLDLENQPAGAGVLGILLTIFIVFIITDMLCATHIFGFVNCINK
tara:strand:+ start:57945 stop:58346 length:402 start_codon:yes stop_codon:yes gene_type:complete